MSSTKMTENMFAVLYVFILCIQVAFSLASCGKTSMFLKIYMSHPEDCSLYYVCFHGRRFLKKCDDDEVFDINLKSCVPKGSKTDSCSSMLGKHSMICSSPGDLLPHAQSCAKFFDCSSTSNGGIPRTRECPYPHLFDRATKSCRYFTEVDCKDRPEPKHPCDYDVKPCHGSHCPPCRSQYPSCVGRPDGLSPWQGRELTQNYVICSFERAIFRGVCTNSRIFHPTKLKCVNSDQVKTTLEKKSKMV
eukprot:XP_011439762.1 PREDICTED: uncharacterized protein LOC105336948 [Crassostrea gigas]